MKKLIPILLVLCGCATVALDPNFSNKWKTGSPQERGQMLLGQAPFASMDQFKALDTAIWKKPKETALGYLGEPEQVWQNGPMTHWFYGMQTIPGLTNSYLRLIIDDRGIVVDTGMAAWDAEKGKNPTEGMTRLK